MDDKTFIQMKTEDIRKLKETTLEKAKPLAIRFRDASDLNEGEQKELTQFSEDLEMINAELLVRERMETRSKLILDQSERLEQDEEGKPLSRRSRGGQGEEEDEPRLSPGEVFTRSESFKRSMATRGANPVAMDEPVSFETLLSPTARELRTLVYSGTPSASMLLPDIVPGIFRDSEPVSAIRQVLGSSRTSSDTLIYMTESGFTNNAAEVSEPTTVGGAVAKPESAISFTEASEVVRTIAHWIPITRQAMQDTPFLESYINGRLMDGLERRIANQLINGDGNAPNISGLLDRSGIQIADEAYFLANEVRDAGTDNEDANRIRRGKRLVTVTGRARPTFVLANPDVMEKWDTLTNPTGGYIWGGPSGSGGVPRMWGIPMYEDEYVPAGHAIMGDGSFASVVDRMDAAIYTTDSHSDFFTKNMFVILAEVRLTLAVFRPAAFVDITLSV